MLQEFLLFIFAILLGGMLRFLYTFTAWVAKKTKLRFMRYVMDVVWCSLAFVAFVALTLFLGGGEFKTFTLLGILAGVGLASLLFLKKSTNNSPHISSKKAQTKVNTNEKS